MRSPKLQHPQKSFAVVIWNDAHGNPHDQSERGIKHEPERFHTYGWVVRSDEIGVTVAPDWCVGEDSWRDTTFIPRKMILEEIVLDLSRKRQRKEVSHEPNPQVVSD